MSEFLKKIVIYGLASFIVLNLIAFLSLYFLGKSCFYKQQFVQNGVKETNFDYIVLGSSTGLTTLDTKLIDSISGKSGLNISIDDSGLSSHYLMLQQFYEIGKKTDMLVLCVIPSDLENNNPQINTNDYRFLPSLWDENVHLFFKELKGKDKWIYSSSRYVPLVGVSYFNSELFFPGVLSLFQPKKRNLFDDKGNYSYPIPTIKTENLDFTSQNKNISLHNPYLYKIIEFCKNNHIKLLLYQSPISQVNAIYPDKIKVLNHSSLLNSEGLFFDAIHVNKKGRKICSEQFATYLIKNQFDATENLKNDF